LSVERIHTSGAPTALARYSQAIRTGNTLYIQGIIPIDPSTGYVVVGDIETHTRRVFESMKAILEGAGMRMENVVKVTVFLADLADYSKFNDVYNTYFQADPPPARTTVGANLLLGARLEIDAIAYMEMGRAL
jgi:2-iminobutanoate/2-iminopropanoate deaminase